MLRSCLLLILSALPAFAQPDVTTLNFTARHGNPGFYLGTVNISGTGTIGIGTCSDTIGTGLCAALTNSGGPTLDPNSTAPTKIRVWDSGGARGLAVGSYRSTFSVTGAVGGTFTLTVNLTIVAETVGTFASIGGICVGCTNSGAEFQDADTSPFSPARRPGGTYLPPTTRGATFQDDNTFGSTKTVLVPPDPTKPFFGTGALAARILNEDSVTSSINADATYTWSDNMSGFPFLVNMKTGADDYSIGVGISDGGNQRAWDYSDNDLFYTVVSLNVYVSHKAGPYNSTVRYTYTPTGTTTKLANGGDGGVALHEGKQIWCLFTGDGNDQKIVMLDVHAGTAVIGSYAGTAVTWGGNTIPRQCTAFPSTNVPDGKLYVELGGYVASELFSLKNGVLTDEGPFPQSPSAPQHGRYGGPTGNSTDCNVSGICYSSSHHTGFVSKGVQYWFFVDQEGSDSQMIVARFDKGVNNMARAVEDTSNGGGGAYSTFLLNHTQANVSQDQHCSSATLAPIVACELDDVGVCAWTVNTISTGATTTITYNTPATGCDPVNGNVLLMNQVLGVPELAGVNTACTVASVNLGAHTFNCSGLTTTGTYTAGSGSFTVNTTPPLVPHQGEIFVYDFTDIANKNVKVTRLGHHRSVQFINDRAGSYYGAPHVSISPDGTKVVYMSNYGIPDYYGIYTMSTGFNPMGASVSGAVLKGAIIH